MRRKPRQVRPEEQALWNKAVEKTTPMKLEDPAEEVRAAPRPAMKQPQQKVPRFRVGEHARDHRPAHVLAPSISEHVAQAPIAMDRKAFGRMKKGRMVPEARIDLHGMSVAQAHAALTRFVLDSVASERRLILVITGKGKAKPDDGPIPVRHGALRHQVPHWLHTAPLKPHVLQLAEAHLKHGGQGAYYVYLRRRRE